MNLILLIFSVCAFNNAKVLSKMQDENVIAIEKYVREKLPTIFEIFAKEGKELSTTEKSFFYSIKYVKNTAEFEFMEGKRILIKEIVNHIQTKNSSHVADCVSKATENCKDDRKNIVNTSIGLVFGDLERWKESKKKIAVKPNDDYKKNLLKALVEMNKSYTTRFPSLNPTESSEELIDLNLTNINSIKANVRCIFCKEKTYSISCKKTGSWILSNLKRHYDSCCAPEKNEQKIPKKNEDTSLKNENKGVNSDLGQEASNSSKLNTLNSNQGAVFIAQYNIFKTQLILQNIKMTNTSHNNEEEERYCELGTDPKEFEQMKLCKIPSDGDCLLGAAVHQFYHVKIGSDEYKQRVIQLRLDVVDHIRTNLELYERNLMDRIYDKCPKTKLENPTEILCNTFLNEYLIKQGHWCGSESMKAISKLLKSNIVVFSERGEVYFGESFNASYKNVIMVAFRLSKSENHGEKISNMERNHYDSVVKLNENVIEMCFSNLMLKHVKSLEKTVDVICLE